MLPGGGRWSCRAFMGLHRIPNSTANDVIMSDVSAAQMCLVALLQRLCQLRLFLVQHGPIALCASCQPCLSYRKLSSMNAAHLGRWRSRCRWIERVDPQQQSSMKWSALRLAARNAADEPSRLESRKLLKLLTLKNHLLHRRPKTHFLALGKTHLVPIAPEQVELSPGFPSPFTGGDPSI